MSDRDRWQRVKGVFLEALERAPDARPGFLAAACGDDAELRREVESMLAVQGEAEGFLSRPAVPLPAVPDLVGRRIGPYRVLGRVGEGGMGVVYRALRDDDVFQKTVALKLVRGGATRVHLERLAHERQILARLQHPNIATILDGGATEEGQPFLVMEYVEGTPIDAYCDVQGLGTRERLALFQAVCAAVQYAHQNLVVHRDLKPANILVSADGQPKLLDFGIAKLLAVGVDPDAAPTATLLPMMTPEYASPEQVRGQPVTTASDVYSLGVVLYELLTGTRPYVVRADSLAEIVRVVCETEPSPPSAAAAGAGGPGGGRTASELRGDLDTIVAKALRKEPARRYLSAFELSEDLRRHLQGLPVHARADTLRYRAGKFVGRHRLAVAAAALLALSLVGGSVMTLRQARLAEAQRRRAEESLRDVRRIANSLIFEIHDAVKDLPGATPARETIVKRALEYLSRLEPGATDPAFKRELAGAYERIGDVQGQLYAGNLGRSADALASYRRALALRESVAADPAAPGEARSELALSYRRVADLLRTTGDTAQAGDLYRKVLAIQEGLARADPRNGDLCLELARSRYFLGDLELKAGNTASALAHFARSVQDYETPVCVAAGTQRARYGAAVTRFRAASAHLQAGDITRASHTNGLALATFERLAAEDPRSVQYRRAVSLSLSERGVMLRNLGDPLGAAAALGRAQAEMEAMISADPANVQLRRDLMLVLINLGVAWGTAGQPVRAIAPQQRALATAEALAAADPASVAARESVIAAQVSLGETLREAGRAPEARAMFSRALSGIERAPAENRGSQARSFAASASRGLGLLQLQAAQARSGNGAAAELRAACTLLARSRDIWLGLKETQALSKSGAADLEDVTKKLAACPGPPTAAR